MHDAQLLYLLARHFPDSAWRDAAGRARDDQRRGERESGAVRCRRPTRLLALDAFREDVGRRRRRWASREIGKDGRERALTLPAGAMPKVDRLGDGREAASSRRKGRCVPTSSSTSRDSIASRRPTEMSRGIEIFREFVDAKGNP